MGSGRAELGSAEADALHAIGIDLETVRSKVEDSFGQGALDEQRVEPAPGMVSFTARAKKSMRLAFREARRLGRDHIGPEHVLLGLIREGDGVAAVIIQTRSTLSDMRQRLLAELDPAA